MYLVQKDVGSSGQDQGEETKVENGFYFPQPGGKQSRTEHWKDGAGVANPFYLQ